jgi:hypothetical protein
MKLATLPPWYRDPVQHAQTLRNREKSRLQTLDIGLQVWDHEAANQANKFDGGKYMKFADIPAEVVQVAAIRTKGYARLTRLADGSVLKIVGLRSEEFTKGKAAKNPGEKGTRYLAKSKGGDEFVISPQFNTILEKALKYAKAHGTGDDANEVEVTLGSVTQGKGDKAITRRILK